MILIDADALIALLKEEYKKVKQAFDETSVFQAPNDVALYGALMQEVGAVIHELESQPTVDAVPVVRCKECVWNREKEWVDCYMSGMHGRNINNFCSRGERKEE